MSASTLRCIFCDNPRTNKRGEHVWDDWLNRDGGRTIRDPSTTYHYGVDGELIRKHSTSGLHVALPVVCDPCNNAWMSDVSSTAKDLLEPSIRLDATQDFDDIGVLTITVFAFLKAAVLDWSSEDRRTPCISRAHCLSFRDSLTSTSFDGDIAFPDGLQVWIGRYQRMRKMEALTFTEEMSGNHPRVKGYRILVITYVVGSFLFQLTCPRWLGLRTRKRPSVPFFEPDRDTRSAAVWPDVSVAHWPPHSSVDSRTLESFRERFRRVRFHRM